MAFYSKSVSITKNTARKDAASTTLKVWSGVIHNVKITFPDGCAGLAHVKILHGNHSLYPSNDDESFKGDGRTIDFNDYYELGASDNTLTIVTWNLDQGYDHTPEIEIGVLPAEVVTSYKALAGLGSFLEKIGKRLGIKL
jgi:hypothetical protein